MSTTTPDNYTIIQQLPEDQKFSGENFKTWRETMLMYGKIKGLDLYWEGRVTVPQSPQAPSDTPSNATTALTTSVTTNTTATPGATSNDQNPNLLEYDLRESIAFLTIWNNVKNPIGLGFSSYAGRTSHELWSHIRTEYALVSNIIRQRKEDALRACRYSSGSITGEGGYAERMRTLRREAVDAGATITDATFITIFLDSFPRSMEWRIITGNLLGTQSFALIAVRLQEYWLRSAGGDVPPTVPPEDSLTAMRAEIADLRALLRTQQNQMISFHNLMALRRPADSS